MQEVSAIYMIRSKYQTLSTKEKIIADFILEHPKDSVNPSIEQLAQNIGISESTMVRFARKLGYSGYQRFRIALARETIAGNAQIFESEVQEGEDVVDLVFNNAKHTLDETLSNTNRQTIQETALLLKKAKRIYLMGLGGSNTLAQDAYHKLMRIGLTCQYASDYHMQLMLASQSDEADAAILISHTGQGYDTLSLAEEFHNKGCPTIILTSNATSPLAKLGTYVLPVSSGNPTIVSESFSARIATLVLIDVLYVQILELLQQEGLEHLNTMRSVIAKRRI